MAHRTHPVVLNDQNHPRRECWQASILTDHSVSSKTHPLVVKTTPEENRILQPPNIISSIDHSDLHLTPQWLQIYADKKPKHYYIDAILLSVHHPYLTSCINRYTHIKKYYSTSRTPYLQILYGDNNNSSHHKHLVIFETIPFQSFIREITSGTLTTYDHLFRIPSQFLHHNHIIVTYKQHCFLSSISVTPFIIVDLFILRVNMPIADLVPIKQSAFKAISW